MSEAARWIAARAHGRGDIMPRLSGYYGRALLRAPAADTQLSKDATDTPMIGTAATSRAESRAPTTFAHGPGEAAPGEPAAARVDVVVAAVGEPAAQAAPASMRPPIAAKPKSNARLQRFLGRDSRPRRS